MVLNEEQLDLVTGGYAGTYTGTRPQPNGATRARTFTVKISWSNKNSGTFNVTGQVEYKLSRLFGGNGFGSALEKGTAGAGALFRQSRGRRW